MTGSRAAVTGLAGLLIACSLGACGRQRMANEPRYEPYEAADEFADGSSARWPAAGNVQWREPYLDPTATVAVPVTADLLARGREHYEIHCVPCHGYAGAGDGIVVQRGFPAPPAFAEPRLRAVPDDYLYEVITHGRGVMFGYASRVRPAERRAIVAYLRALQLSQHADLDALPTSLRASVAAAATEGGR
jgi:mono/diheme cytochrome c family protein